MVEFFHLILFQVPHLQDKKIQQNSFPDPHFCYGGNDGVIWGLEQRRRGYLPPFGLGPQIKKVLNNFYIIRDSIQIAICKIFHCFYKIQEYGNLFILSIFYFVQVNLSISCVMRILCRNWGGDHKIHFQTFFFLEL